MLALFEALSIMITAQLALITASEPSGWQIWLDGMLPPPVTLPGSRPSAEEPPVLARHTRLTASIAMANNISLGFTLDLLVGIASRRLSLLLGSAVPQSADGGVTGLPLIPRLPQPRTPP